MKTKSLVERAQSLIAAVDRLTGRKDDAVSELVIRARKHAKALDPGGRKYLRFRVPEDHVSLHVDQKKQSVTLKGSRSYSGGTDAEEWTMPLALANAEDPEKWLEDIANIAAHEAQQEAELAQRQAEETERRERYELQRLQQKYGENR